MNIFKAMAVKDIEEATRAIPVIDFGPALAGAPGGLEAVAAQVRRASEEVGFFYLAGHGVPPEVVDRAFAASREFHAMGPDEKRRLAINENNIGYLAPNQSIQGARHRPQGHTAQPERELLHQPRPRSRPPGRGRGAAAARAQPVARGHDAMRASRGIFLAQMAHVMSSLRTFARSELSTESGQI